MTTSAPADLDLDPEVVADLTTIRGWVQGLVGLPIRIESSELVRISLSRFAAEIRRGSPGSPVPAPPQEAAATPAANEPRYVRMERVARDDDGQLVAVADGEPALGPPPVVQPPPVATRKVVEARLQGNPRRGEVSADVMQRRALVLNAFRSAPDATIKDVADHLRLPAHQVYEATAQLRRAKRLAYEDRKWIVLDGSPPPAAEPGLRPTPGVRHEDCNNINACLDVFLQTHGTDQKHGSCPPGCTGLVRSE